LILKPDIAPIMAELAKYEESELKTLLEVEDFFWDFFNNQEGVKQLGENYAKLLTSLKSQAEENLKLKEKVDSEV